MTPFLLLAAGLVLVFFEFFLPGAIMGTLGGIALFSAIFIFIQESNSPLYILLFILSTFALLALTIRLALWSIKHSNPKSGLYSRGDQAGYVASSFDQSAIGKEGIVLTDLRPGGHILVDKKRHLAISQSGYISKGETVVVIGGEGESLIVKYPKKDGNE